MPKSLVDTDILSEYLRAKDIVVQDRAREYLREYGHLTVSVVTMFEVVRGRYQARQPDQAARFLRWSKRLEVLPFDTDCAARAGELAGEMMRVGTPLGVADVIIAATALVHGLVVVTGNSKHYERLELFGVRLENWRATR